MNTFMDVRQKVKEIAVDLGVDPEISIQLAQKCWDDIPMWRPLGGATSFADVDAQKEANQYASAVGDNTYALQSIIQNITSSDELDSADLKAAAIKQAADEYRTRVNSLTLENAGSKTSFLDKIKNTIRGKKTAIEQLPVLTAQDDVELENRGFKVYVDTSGELRWLSLSSNSFEDLDRELFTTKALEEAIEHGDKTGERGPLQIYHVPGTVIGQCDYQALAGRFLVESGTFDDTPLGRKAVEYFANSDEEHQVSIGYQYHLGDEEDGVYEWTRIKERSVCPFGTAANPWTDFKVIGESPMDANKVATLEKIFGKDLAADVISKAEERTKELEQTVRFKEATPVTLTVTGNSLEEIQASLVAEYEKAKKTPAAAAEDAADGGADDADEDANGNKKPAGKKEAEAPAFGQEQLVQLASLITDLTAQVSGLQSEVKELKKSDDEKMGDIMRPREANLMQGQRPSEASNNLVIDQEAMKSVVDSANAESEVNPIQDYLDMVFHPAARVG